MPSMDSFGALTFYKESDLYSFFGEESMEHAFPEQKQLVLSKPVMPASVRLRGFEATSFFRCLVAGP